MTAYEMVAKARNLPNISGAALKLVGLLDESGDNHRETIDLIKSDSMLTAKLLRIANSSAMGLAEPVSSLDQAALLLGYRQILSLVMSVAFGGALKGAPAALGASDRGLWRHSYVAAIAAETAVKLEYYSGVDSSVAFTTGLLHDMGRLVMAQTVSSEKQALIERHISEDKLEGVVAERKVLGTDHAEVGSCLLHVWRLPEWMVEAVANHHEPVVEPTPKLSSLAYLANRIAHFAAAEKGAPAILSAEDHRIFALLKIEAVRRDELTEKVRESARQAEELMGSV